HVVRRARFRLRSYAPVVENQAELHFLRELARGSQRASVRISSDRIAARQGRQWTQRIEPRSNTRQCGTPSHHRPLGGLGESATNERQLPASIGNELHHCGRQSAAPHRGGLSN